MKWMPAILLILSVSAFADPVTCPPGQGGLDIINQAHRDMQFNHICDGYLTVTNQGGNNPPCNGPIAGHAVCMLFAAAQFPNEPHFNQWNRETAICLQDFLLQGVFNPAQPYGAPGSTNCSALMTGYTAVHSKCFLQTKDPSDGIPVFCKFGAGTMLGIAEMMTVNSTAIASNLSPEDVTAAIPGIDDVVGPIASTCGSYYIPNLPSMPNIPLPSLPSLPDIPLPSLR